MKIITTDNGAVNDSGQIALLFKQIHCTSATKNWKREHDLVPYHFEY